MSVLVIGDVMIDAYMWGSVYRQSPEAPVPVVEIDGTEMRLGGAANVALNLKALGCEVGLVGAIGNDHYTQRFLQLMEDSSLESTGIKAIDGRKTTVKTRIINGKKHVVRVDEEDVHPLNQDEEDYVLAGVAALLKRQAWDLILFEDYNKGLLTPYIISEIISFAQSKGIPTAVDPKKDNFFAYQGVDLFKPNLRELNWGLETEIQKTDIKELARACMGLRNRLPCKKVLLTLAEGGMVLIGDEPLYVPAHPRKIVDVSGAGDTVISVAALAFAMNIPEEDILALSNLAGGLVCEYPGVVPITGKELEEEASKIVFKA